MTKSRDVQERKKKMEVGARSDAHQYTSEEIVKTIVRKIVNTRQKTMWADQAADKRAISVVLMMLSPVVVDGKRSVPAVGEGVKCR